MKLQKTSKISVGVFMLCISLSLSACGGRVKSVAPTPVATTPTDTQPIVEDPISNGNNTNNIIAQPAAPNVQSGSFKVDQSTFSSWQAKGIAVGGGFIYLSVADIKGVLQYGSVVKMNSSDGKNWKNIGTSWGGLSHPIGKTVQGLAISGGTIVAADTNAKVYTIEASSGKVKTVKSSGGTDVAAGGGSIYIANGSVNRTDVSVSSSSPVSTLSASGGIGADNLGNVYAVSGNSIKKSDVSGQVSDIIMSDLSGPIDVAVDSRNGDLFVLEQSMVKRFNSQGQLRVSFSNGASKPVAIAVDESGSIYVADQGATNKDSKVVKFGPSVDAAPTSPTTNSMASSYNYGY